MAVVSHKLFLNSCTFYAFIDRADINHSKTVKTVENLGKMNYHLFTSSLNVSETYTALAREVGSSIALEFLETILQSDIEILYPQKADYSTALKVLNANRNRQLNLKEVLNATLMQKRGISQILTFTYWHNLFGTSTSNLAS